MERHKNKEKITLQVAAKALDISERTLQRYAAKGLLTRIREGHRIFFLADEIRQLRQEKNDSGQANFQIDDTLHIINVPSDKYDKIVAELGELRAKCNYLLEYKIIQERTQKELTDTKELVSETNKWFTHVLEENQKVKEKNQKIENDINIKNNELTELKNNLNQLQKELAKINNIKSKNNIQENLLTKKDNELEEVKKNMTRLRQELQKVKSRNIFKRIFNK